MGPYLLFSGDYNLHGVTINLVTSHGVQAPPASRSQEGGHLRRGSQPAIFGAENEE